MIIQTPLTHKLLFDRDGEKVSCYLRGIDRKLLIKVGLLLIYEQDRYSELNSFISIFFSQENLDFVIDILSKYNNILETQRLKSEYSNHKYYVSSSHTGIELLKQAFSLSEDDSKYSNKEVECLLFKAILAINNDLVEGELTLEQQYPEKVDMSFKTLATFLPYNDFTNIPSDSRMFIQLYKTKLFFEFCRVNVKYDNLLSQMLVRYGHPTGLSYIYNLLKIFLISYDSKKNGYPGILLDKYDENYVKDLSILSNLSISFDLIINLTDNVDYKSFRGKPLIKTAEDEFYIIHPTFCLDRIYNSLIFAFKEINATLSKSNRISDVFSDYTSNFSERTLFYKVIDEIFPKKKLIKLSGQACLANNSTQGEPDFYIRDWNDIFLFEFKDLLFNGDKKESINVSELESYLYEKLVLKSSGKGSAVKQIVANIQRIQSNNFPWDSKLKYKKQHIWPILVVGNSTFTTIGMAEIIRYYFDEELKANNINKKYINDIVLIDIDTLILYKNIFKNNTVKFKEVLLSYNNYIKVNRPYKLNSETVVKNAFHSYFSLSQFMNDTFEKDERCIAEIASFMKEMRLDLKTEMDSIVLDN